MVAGAWAVARDAAALCPCPVVAPNAVPACADIAAAKASVVRTAINGRLLLLMAGSFEASTPLGGRVPGSAAT